MLVNVRLHAADARGRMLSNNVLVNVLTLADSDSDWCIDCLHVIARWRYFNISILSCAVVLCFYCYMMFSAFTTVHHFDLYFIFICWWTFVCMRPMWEVVCWAIIYLWTSLHLRSVTVIEALIACMYLQDWCILTLVFYLVLLYCVFIAIWFLLHWPLYTITICISLLCAGERSFTCGRCERSYIEL